jgi:hypothetical protein
MFERENYSNSNVLSFGSNSMSTGQPPTPTHSKNDDCIVIAKNTTTTLPKLLQIPQGADRLPPLPLREGRQVEII